MKNEFDYLNDVKMDFSVYGEDQLSEKEIRNMKKQVENKGAIKVRKRVAIAAVAAVVALTGTAFASGLAGNIIKTISTGHNKFIQTDPTEAFTLSDELQGKFFDENGTPLGALSYSDMDNIYDAEGNKIDGERYAKIIEEAYGGEVKVYEDGNVSVELAIADDDNHDHEHEFASIEDAQNTANFDIKVPQKLPEGYKLDRVYTYTDDKGDYSGDYMTLKYVNGDNEITIFERIINDETAFESATNGEIEEIKINGCTAAVEGNSSINWETKDGVSVGIYVRDGLTKAEMIKFAKSVK